MPFIKKPVVPGLYVLSVCDQWEESELEGRGLLKAAVTPSWGSDGLKSYKY